MKTSSSRQSEPKQFFSPVNARSFVPTLLEGVQEKPRVQPMDFNQHTSNVMRLARDIGSFKSRPDAADQTTLSGGKYEPPLTLLQRTGSAESFRSNGSLPQTGLQTMRTQKTLKPSHRGSTTQQKRNGFSKQKTIEMIIKKKEQEQDSARALNEKKRVKITDDYNDVAFTNDNKSLNKRSEDRISEMMSASASSRFGMYGLSKEEMARHRAQLKSSESRAIVRADSILQCADDPEKHKSVARRIFHNHEVTHATGINAARKAYAQSKATMNTISAATDVAQGFNREVEKMNRGFAVRLEAIQQAERAEKERREAKKRAIEAAKRAKELARLNKIKARPFNLATDSRANRKAMNFKLGDDSGQYPISNLAFERQMYGAQVYHSGNKNGLMTGIEQAPAYETT